MKTDTINKKLWQFEESSNDIDVIINTGSRLPCFISLDSSYKNEYRDKEQRLKDAELIVTAVNACKEINPDNPLNVANGIPELYDAAVTAVVEYFSEVNKEPKDKNHWYWKLKAAIKTIKN